MENTAIVIALPSVNLDGAMLLGRAYARLDQDKFAEKIEQDKAQAMRLSAAIAPLLKIDISMPQGAALALRTVLEIANLGLEKAADGPEAEEKAAALITKNSLEAIYQVGLTLLRENTRQSDNLWQKSITRSDRLDDRKSYYGLLPRDLENELLTWREFAPCAHIAEIARREQKFARVREYLAIAEHLPVGLITGKTGLFHAMEFACLKFARPDRETPAADGGIVDFLLCTLMVKCVLGSYVAPGIGARMGHDYEGWYNWCVSQQELAQFITIIASRPEEIESRMPRAREILEIYFLHDARCLSAKAMRKREVEKHILFVQECFGKLVQAAQEFHRDTPIDGNICQAMDRFWQARIVLGETTRHDEDLHHVSIPRLDQLLPMSLEDIILPLAGFANWPAEFKVGFVKDYPFTQRLARGADSAHSRGEKFARVLKLLAQGGDGADYMGMVMARLRWDEISAQVIYAAFVVGDEQIRNGLLNQAPKMGASVQDMRLALSRANFVSADHQDTRLLISWLAQIEQCGGITPGHWAGLLAASVSTAAFLPFYRQCPPAARVDGLAKMAVFEREMMLKQLSVDELRELIRHIVPAQADGLIRDDDTADYLAKIVATLIQNRRNR